MNITVCKFTVFFEDPFWIGLYERDDNGKYSVCKITFGAEPKDGEVYEFMLKNRYDLKFSLSAESEVAGERHINPKRMKRLVNRQIDDASIGTKAQRLLKLRLEEGKKERKLCISGYNEEEKQRRFELRQKKRKEKHRGH